METAIPADLPVQENALIIVNAGDLPAAVALAGSLDDYHVYLFDPTLMEAVTASPLRNVHLMDSHNRLEYAEIEKWANDTAFATEQELQLVSSEVIADLSICSWQYLSFRYMFMAIRWYTSLWETALSDIPDSKFHIFVCDNPSHYYLPSFIPALLLLEHLTARGLKYSAFTYGKLPEDTDVIPDLLSFDKSAQYDILTHLPTCFYDYAHFNEEIKLSGKSVINLRSQYWDTPIEAAKTIALTRIAGRSASFSAALGFDAELFSARLAETLDGLLKAFIKSPVYRKRQSQYFAELYKSQSITYFLLERYFSGKKPAKMLLSDHDAGFHGPIVSFAQKHNIPVLLVPHSKTYGNIEFEGSNIASCTHPIQGEIIADRNGRRVRNHYLAYPEKFAGSSAMSAGIKKIGLLLNGLSLNGILVSRYATYIGGLKRLAQWCRQNDIELSIRCRPGVSMMDLISGETGVPVEVLMDTVRKPLYDFAKELDLCLMYGTPTTGALDFLRNSIPILNPIPEDLPLSLLNTVNSKVVPRASVGATIDLLETFIADDINFSAFRTTQFRDYVNLFSTALPLRHYL